MCGFELREDGGRRQGDETHADEAPSERSKRSEMFGFDVAAAECSEQSTCDRNPKTHRQHHHHREQTVAAARELAIEVA